MKKITFKTTAIFAGLILVCAVWFSSCSMRPTTVQLAKANSWNKLFGERAIHFTADQIVCPSLTEKSINNYKKLYSNPSTSLSTPDMVMAYKDMVKGYTENVAFGGKELGNWIDDMTTNTNVDSIKICFGVYTQEMVDNFPTRLRDKLGRLTVFLKPIAKNKKNAVFLRASTYTGTLNNGCLARTQLMAAGDTSDNFNLGSVYP